jgi:hypothetical protein
MYTCYAPIHIKNDGANYQVPCGKCPKCIRRRINGWVFRLKEEEKNCFSSYFLTLTYAPKTVPITKNGQQTLDKRDHQLFLKRLRKFQKNKIKYYMCGEYGGKTMRPHYHYIIFNADQKNIEKAWNKGITHYGEANIATATYTLNYLDKELKIPVYKGDKRQKEFSCMSKGLGLSYLTENIVNWHKRDLKHRMYLNMEGNKKIAMPKYYKEKLYDWKEKAILKEHHLNQLNDHNEKEQNKANFDLIQRNRGQAIIKEFKKRESKLKKRASV